MNNDSLSLLIVHHLAFRTDMESPLARCVHIGNSIDAVDARSGREIRALDMFHVFFYRDYGLAHLARFKDTIHVEVHGTGHFGQVVRGDSSRHTDSDAVAAVEQQVWKSGGQDRGLLFRIVKIRLEIYGVLVDVIQHVLGNAIQPAFRVTHSGWWVAVN